MLVAPVGVELQVKAMPTGHTTAAMLAQSLQLGCNKYTRDATGSDLSTCAGKFVFLTDAQAGSTYDQNQLFFQKPSDETSVLASRGFANFEDYKPALKPASRQSWNVGDVML